MCLLNNFSPTHDTSCTPSIQVSNPIHMIYSYPPLVKSPNSLPSWNIDMGVSSDLVYPKTDIWPSPSNSMVCNSRTYVKKFITPPDAYNWSLIRVTPISTSHSSTYLLLTTISLTTLFIISSQIPCELPLIWFLLNITNSSFLPKSYNIFEITSLFYPSLLSMKNTLNYRLNVRVNSDTCKGICSLSHNILTNHCF